MRSRTLLAGTVGALLLVGTVGASVVAAGDATVPETTGLMTLTQNTTLTADHAGTILMAKDGITLDCAGHTVHGPGVAGYWGGITNAPASYITVRNCVVTGFSVNGMFLVAGTGIRVEANTVSANGGHGIALDAVTDSVVVGNTARDNGTLGPANGIFVTHSTNVAVMGNTVSGNMWTGIILSLGTTRSSVVGNTASWNGTGIDVEDTSDNLVLRNKANRNANGIAVLNSTGTLVSGNVANGNQFVGISLAWGSSGNTLTANIANGNNDGFNIDGSDPDGNGPHHGGCDRNVLSGNTANNNRHFGFVVSSLASYNTLTYNTALRNAYYDAWEEGTGTGDVWVANRFGTKAGI